jgi:hypothetical protein
MGSKVTKVVGFHWKTIFGDPPTPHTVLFLVGQRGLFSKVVLGFRNFGMSYEGLGEMFEGDSAYMCAEKFPFMLMGG